MFASSSSSSSSSSDRKLSRAWVSITPFFTRGLPSWPTKQGARDFRGLSGITCTTYREHRASQVTQRKPEEQEINLFSVAHPMVVELSVLLYLTLHGLLGTVLYLILLVREFLFRERPDSEVNSHGLLLSSTWQLSLQTKKTITLQIKPENMNQLHHLCISDGYFNLYTRFDADGGDLLDDFRWTVQINQALVDPHLEAIPGFGSLTTGSFPGGDAQGLEGGRKQF
ncbi:hypothetical protein F7725_028675 [Dissostichus mawsoni]|uniref:Uncharacterized protein n=1 Tax=Dissostichus mawsoni TaxID=36200 RepID=A0A7J5XHN3_DISMA|nr:hypothetical protein F7725_028675 [Dissostichus mawsoni]